MTPGFTRRRAERFHETLEGVGVAAPEAVAWVDLIDLVDRLRATPTVQPRAEFVTDLRGRLLVAAAGELPALVPAAVTDPAADRLRLAPSRPRRERRIAAGIGALALVGAGTSMAVAAQGALPGETLYPLKRALENVQTGVEQNPDARGAALLDHASGRLAEVRTLVLLGDQDDEVTVATLGDFADQAAQATDLLMASYVDGGPASDVEVVRDFTQDSMDTIVGLQDVVASGPTSTGLDRTALLVTQIDDAAHRLCPECGGPLILPTVALDPSALESTRRIEVPLARPRLPSSEEPVARRDRPRRDGAGRGEGAAPEEVPVRVDESSPVAGSGQDGGSEASATDPGTPPPPDTSVVPSPDVAPTDVPASDPFQTLTHGLGGLSTGGDGSGSGSAGQPSGGGSGAGTGSGSGGGHGGGSGLEETVEDVAGELLP